MASSRTPAASVPPRPVAVRVADILSQAMRACATAMMRGARRLDLEVVGTGHSQDSAETPTLEARVTHLEILQGVRDAR